MALPHHNRAYFCNLFLKVDWIELRGGSVRLKRPLRPLCGSVRLKRPSCGSCALSALCTRQPRTASVKRACMAAENVDAGAGPSKMLASSWFSALREKPGGLGG